MWLRKQPLFLICKGLQRPFGGASAITQQIKNRVLGRTVWFWYFSSYGQHQQFSYIGRMVNWCKNSGSHPRDWVSELWLAGAPGDCSGNFEQGGSWSKRNQVPQSVGQDLGRWQGTTALFCFMEFHPPECFKLWRNSHRLIGRDALKVPPLSIEGDGISIDILYSPCPVTMPMFIQFWGLTGAWDESIVSCC